MKYSANHIELFAGCGGLSLGLDQAGFSLTLANELSPMAAESFAYNFFNENLEEKSKLNQCNENTLWLNSNFSDLKSRLRENPFTYPPFEDNSGISDLPQNIKKLKGKLIVGSIIELNRLLESYPELVNKLKDGFGDGRLDLVSGGPPCQSFSMAGLRRRDCEKNTLPWEFANFVNYTQPKIAMLENVTGILRAFNGENGQRFHAWYEVAKVFATYNYVPLCLHVNARLAGVAQNRPRFIMIAVRHDHLLSIIEKLDTVSNSLFTEPLAFFEKVKNKGETLEFGHLNYIDAIKDHALFESSFLKPLVSGEQVSVKDALDDLKLENPSNPSFFVQQLNKKFHCLDKRTSLSNHDFRNNSDLVKRRFRIYQILQNIDDRSVTKAVFSILKGELDLLSEHSWNMLKKHEFKLENNELFKFKTKTQLELYLHQHPTKKQTQKALVADAPAPAALSIPDDACHYDHQELRVLTVREMARIQSFPDNFVFRSKITTGGQMRKFEVPQYTQVGNAVPPLLGYALGLSLQALL